jgi:hypothetical protein
MNKALVVRIRSFTYPDSKFDYAHPKLDSVPNEYGSLNCGWHWYIEPGTGEQKFGPDSMHANFYGCYLIACVWYEVIFNESALNISFVPSKISAEDAVLLRKVAHEVVLARYPDERSVSTPAVTK